MKQIPQHREDGNLNDLQSFITDLEPFQRKVDYWRVCIDECIGPACAALEELTEQSPRLSHIAFTSLCYSITQTIDGVFEGYLADSLIVKLEAVDSTYWEISSSVEFESYMVGKYGEFHG